MYLFHASNQYYTKINKQNTKINLYKYITNKGLFVFHHFSITF